MLSGMRLGRAHGIVGKSDFLTRCNNSNKCKMYQNVQKNRVMYACVRICKSDTCEYLYNILNYHIKIEKLDTGTANAQGQA